MSESETPIVCVGVIFEGPSQRCRFDPMRFLVHFYFTSLFLLVLNVLEHTDVAKL